MQPATKLTKFKLRPTVCVPFLALPISEQDVIDKGLHPATNITPSPPPKAYFYSSSICAGVTLTRKHHGQYPTHVATEILWNRSWHILEVLLRNTTGAVQRVYCNTLKRNATTVSCLLSAVSSTVRKAATKQPRLYLLNPS